MLGFSDGTKDGGYLMANWMQYNAQSIVAKTCQAHRIDFRLFHGRGGSVGRGGGRANQAIFALPAECCNGRLRVTEQGEVIAFRYSLPKLAHRHLEQVLHAMIITTARREKNSCRSSILGDSHAYALCDLAANTAMKTYRDLIDDPDFWLWYIQITPIAFISKLPIASRPVSRKQASEVAFSDLRAIPWVFSWTQCRYNVPGWYGLGAALEHVLQVHTDALPALQKLFLTSPYFRMVISNAEREMARAQLDIAQWYATFSTENFHDRIASDYALAKKHVLAITQQENLLDALPVIQTSIRLRNPYAACLHLLQIDLIKRYRASSESPMLLQVLMTSVNGLAAAMQSTG
jgi:phosphoenolpyruvate carboxylase